MSIPPAEVAAHPAASPTKAMIAGEWFDFDADPGGDDTAIRRKQRLIDGLAASLGSEQLAVMAGLGTSLGMTSVSPNGAVTASKAPTMAILFDAVAGLAGFKSAADLSPSSVKAKDIEGLLSACQFKLALDADADVESFLKAAELEVLKLCSFVDRSTDLTNHEIFLRKIARRQTKLARAQIFTTNYDVAFEEAARRIHFHVIDGFGFGNQGSFDGNTYDLDIVRRRKGEAALLEPNVVHLHKLHGSVDWDDIDGSVHRSASPSHPVLIYPSQDKYQMSFRPPYLESMSRFQIALRQTDITLLVVGFGFNDSHIVAPIEAAVRSNIGLRLIVVSPHLSSSKNPTLTKLMELSKSGDRRITLIETTFAQFTALLPDTSPLDEREIHEARTANVWATK
jgi:SIR2-like domain